MIDRIKRGEDPVPTAPAPEPTVAELAERYMKAHEEVDCRPGTVSRPSGAWCVCTSCRSSAISRSRRWTVRMSRHCITGCATRRTRRWMCWRGCSVSPRRGGMTPPRRSPCRSVRRYREHHRERLTPEEYRRLGRVLDDAEADGSVFPSAVPATRLLLLTGCRKPQPQRRSGSLARL